VAPSDVLHVTLKTVARFHRLRTRAYATALRAAFQAGCDRFGFRLVHFSVQPGHLHLVVEARDARALSRGVKGVCIRIAKRLNRMARRTGRVFADRYHVRPARTPRDVRGLLVYVLQNARHHRGTQAPRRGAWVDPYSSARFFDGWSRSVILDGPPPDGPPPVAPPHSWLLRVGWRRHGLVRPEEAPAPHGP
jgi:REP element-mobilizing transposase RayT